MSALQEERSAETRRRLLDATVACLFDRGYAGTTTTEIASRAGVSRGAQLHHFPKKDELVVSALEHVFELRLSEMSVAIAEPPSGSREHRLAVVIDTMWPMFKGPTFYAWLELVVASRTDPALNDAVRDASVRFGEGFRVGLATLLDWPADRQDKLEDLISIVFGQLEALALERVLFAPGENDPPEFVRGLETAKRVSAAIVRELDSSERIEKRGGDLTMSEAIETHAAQDFYFNPWDENFRANPYPHYRPLLAGPPRVVDMGYKFALAARYADVRAVLMDHTTFSSVQPPGILFDEQAKAFGDAPTMLGSDPPTQTRLRRLVSRDFTPRRIRELEPRIREIAKNLIDTVERKGEFDAIGDLANPLPVMVISELLGVPPEEYQRFKNWSDKIIEADNTPPGMPIPDEIKKAFAELKAYFADEILRRRKNPGTDLVSALVAAHDEAEALNADELMQFLMLLLLAGNETTTNLIGNGMLALGRNPDSMAALRAKPDLMRGAIEEMLRYDGPVQATFRTATKDTVVGGTPITAGMGAFVILAAANRDPAQFKDPEKFDIARASNEHVAFGDGIHFCIGAPLARMEGSIAIGAALERFPHLGLKNPDAPVTYKGSYFLRGLSRLDLALE